MADPTLDSKGFELAADLAVADAEPALAALRAAVMAGPLQLETSAPAVRVPCLQLLLAVQAAGRSQGHSVALGPNARAALASFGAEGAV